MISEQAGGSRAPMKTNSTKDDDAVLFNLSPSTSMTSSIESPRKLVALKNTYQKRRRLLKWLIIGLVIVIVVLGVTFGIFAALGLLHNENGFLSSKSVLKSHLSASSASPSSLSMRQTEEESAWEWSKTVILLSIDGFHPSYLFKPNAKNLRNFGNFLHRLIAFIYSSFS
jgi:cytoskeletal protein RodZ